MYMLKCIQMQEAEAQKRSFNVPGITEAEQKKKKCLMSMMRKQDPNHRKDQREKER